MSGDRQSPLGLFDEGEERPSAQEFLESAARERVARAAESAAREPADASGMRLSVIVPARDEEARLGECLRTLLAQDDAMLFPLGREWEVIVVDDASSDRTREVAEGSVRGREGVSVLQAPPFAMQGAERGFTGKTNACWAGAQAARGAWLLFTDADTLHEPGDLARALREAEKYNVKLLSYSPRQVMTGVAQRLVMPLIFSELASVYPPTEVNDPAKATAAANGQFLLVEREAYFAAGGHRAVGRNVLDDVELARNVKRVAVRGEGQGIRLRSAPDALAARMYTGFGDMVEGWTKNLYLLFSHALMLAAWRALDILLWLLPVLWFALPWLVFWQKAAIGLLWLRTVLRFYRRVGRAHMGFAETAISPLGLPLLMYLLVASWWKHRMLHRVTWKGREYTEAR